MVSNKTVFLIGVFSGLWAGLIWGLIIFTGLSQLIKITAFVLGALVFFLLQKYTMKGIVQPNPKEVYTSRFWSLSSLRFRKFSIYFSGVFAPYILFFIGYITFISIK